MKRAVFLVLFATGLLVTRLFAAESKPDDYETISDIAYSDAAPRCKLDLYRPVHETGFATLVWFHGGGLTAGEKFIPEGLKGQHLAIVAVNYRLLPNTSIDGCLDDAASAIAWALRHIQSHGGNPRLVFVGGHSAGAYLATMVATDPTWLAKQGALENKIAGLLAISTTAVTHFALRAQRGIPETQIQVDAYAPLFHVKAGLLPILLVTGDREMELLGRYEENAYYARMLRLAGNKQVFLHELQGYDHGGVVRPAEPLMLRYLKTWSAALAP